MYSASGNYTLDIFNLQKEIGIKTLFGHFDQKQTCSVFTFVQYIVYKYIYDTNTLLVIDKNMFLAI